MLEIKSYLYENEQDYTSLDLENKNKLSIKSKLDNILILLDGYIDIEYYIKVITMYNIKNYKLSIYNLYESNTMLLKIKNIFECIIVENNFKISNYNYINNNLINDYDIIVSVNINTINKNNLKNINKKFYFYVTDNNNLTEYLKYNIIFVKCLSLRFQLENVELLNIDNDCEYKLVYENEILILKKNIDNEKIINKEYYCYINNKIIEFLNISKEEDEIFDKIKIREIINDDYYSKNGIVKYNDNFYINAYNKLEKININKWMSELNYKIDEILYENINNIKNINVVTSNIELHFTILILSYNNKDYIEKNLNSALTQKYKNFDVIFINCRSTDETLNKAKEIGKNYDNFYLFNNTERFYQTENFLLGSASAKHGSIIVSLDGDDWFYDDNVLNKLNKIYLSKRCLQTYGQYVEYPHREVNWTRGSKIKYIEENNFRINKQIVSHLRTWIRELMLMVKYQDLLYENKFPKMAGDISILTYMIELAGNRACFIKDILYVYNTTNIISDNILNIQLQSDTAEYYFNKNAYKLIYKFNENYLNDEIIENIYNNNREIMIILILLQFKCCNYVNEYKHLFNINYLFNTTLNIDKYSFPNIVLKNTTINDYNLIDNINKYIDGINEKIKLIQILPNNNKLSIDLNNYNNLLYDYLKYEFNKHKIEFNKIKYVSNIFKNSGDINIIIPVKNRKDNLICLINNLQSVININNYNFIITVIEYNDNMHQNFCICKQVNYISMNYKGHEFNKSLIANFAYSFNNKSNIEYDYILFHDVDCIIKDNFFNEIFKLDYKNKFIQPYYKKRVLMTTEIFANKIRKNQQNINNINDNTNGIILPDCGSPGGSIFMSKKMFENIGGLDYYYYYDYGPEDAMLFLKLLTLYQVEFSNSPNSEIIHLWHESNKNNNKFYKSINYDIFLLINDNYKKELIELFKNELLNNIL
jgi:glycosyltransferase involved in cell wall biosynthesis